MTYDDWKTTDPRDLEPEEREEEREEEPEEPEEEPDGEPQGTDFSDPC